LEIAGPLISNGSPNSDTVALPKAKRARIARLVGSASAANVRSKLDPALETIGLSNLMVNYTDRMTIVKPIRKLRLPVTVKPCSNDESENLSCPY
jgi:hypothetical protein